MRRIALWAIILILVGASASYIGITAYQNYNSPAAVCQRDAAQGDSEVGFIVVSPTVSVQFGTTSGILSVRISGSACAPITGFAITSMHPLLDGVVNTSFVEYQGDLVSNANPEPVDRAASGSIPVSNATIGERYSLTYRITEANAPGSEGVTITFTATGYTPVSAPLAQNLTSAVNYLVSNYNPALGLIPETPDSSVYWLYSDNFLADWALSQYNSSNVTVDRTAANISTSLSDYPVDSTLVNQYMALQLRFSCVFRAAQNYTISTPHGAQVKVIANNGSGTLADTQYADIAFLDALCQFSHGNPTAAMTAYDDGVKMFDGVGFRDLPYNQTGQYQTYKLALFIYASVYLDQPVNITALTTLLRMQAPSGGFYTGYDDTYSHGATLTNSETTSLAILALESVENQQPP